MNIFEEKAAAICRHADAGRYKISLETIDNVVKLLMELVVLYKQCKKSHEEALKSMKHPGFFERWKFKNLVKKHAPKNAKELTKSSHEIAKTLTVDDVKKMYDA